KAENIRLVGQVPHEELQAWYQKADFFLSGSHYEGSGIAVCEAMSCGCIPIITDIPSFRKMTGKGQCGLLYTPGNAGELLTSLMTAMYLDRAKEKAKVLAQFHRELSFEAIAGKINNLFFATSQIV
ncbi:MAG TPA: glycosyltransferase, partial [Flavisolibacter sp.]|nr:glycosyltransferase [Flavisolibacter sp.]